jgi:hypothetical protein
MHHHLASFSAVCTFRRCSEEFCHPSSVTAASTPRTDTTAAIASNKQRLWYQILDLRPWTLNDLVDFRWNYEFIALNFSLHSRNTQEQRETGDRVLRCIKPSVLFAFPFIQHKERLTNLDRILCHDPLPSCHPTIEIMTRSETRNRCNKGRTDSVKQNCCANRLINWWIKLLCRWAWLPFKYLAAPKPDKHTNTY